MIVCGGDGRGIRMDWWGGVDVTDGGMGTSATQGKVSARRDDGGESEELFRRKARS